MTEYIIHEKIIREVIGTAIPKPVGDNTDVIIPGRHLMEITFRKMGDYVYADERSIDGQPVPGHPFNDPRYSGANILIAGANYGSGSSRQHAPEALHRFGIDAIIAESFAEIFAGNCKNIGLVAVTVPSNYIVELADYVQQKPCTKFDINLDKKKIEYDGNVTEFNIPEGRRQAFLTGTWDAMAVLQKGESRIKKVEKILPYLYF